MAGRRRLVVSGRHAVMAGRCLEVGPRRPVPGRRCAAIAACRFSVEPCCAAPPKRCLFVLLLCPTSGYVVRYEGHVVPSLPAAARLSSHVVSQPLKDEPSPRDIAPLLDNVVPTFVDVVPWYKNLAPLSRRIEPQLQEVAPIYADVALLSRLVASRLMDLDLPWRGLEGEALSEGAMVTNLGLSPAGEPHPPCPT